MKALTITPILRDEYGDRVKLNARWIQRAPINRKIRYKRAVGQWGIPFRGVKRNPIWWAARAKRSAKLKIKMALLAEKFK